MLFLTDTVNIDFSAIHKNGTRLIDDSIHLTYKRFRCNVVSFKIHIETEKSEVPLFYHL